MLHPNFIGFLGALMVADSWRGGPLADYERPEIWALIDPMVGQLADQPDRITTEAGRIDVARAMVVAVGLDPENDELVGSAADELEAVYDWFVAGGVERWNLPSTALD